MSSLISSGRNTILLFVFLFVCSANTNWAQTTAFTYQGKLINGASQAAGNFDMQFRLFDDPDAGEGTQAGATVSKPAVAISSGVFTVQLDFGATVFATGADLYLEMSVRPAGNNGGYTSLAPRQKLTSTPYSVRSINANSADNLSVVCAGCVTDSHISSVDGGKVTGMVANAATATTAGNVTGVVAVENGGTGSTTQNFVDLTSDQSVDGNKIFNANVSANTFSGDGSNLNNLFKIQTFGGQVGNIPTGSNYFFPNGNMTTTMVTVNGSQRITGSASAVFGKTAGTSSINFNLCYQNWSGGIVNPFTLTFLTAEVTSNRSTFAVNNSIVLGAGTYRIGFCASAPNGTADRNDFIQGWVMVTNN